MLQTDLHNPNLDPAKRMKLAEFQRELRIDPVNTVAVFAFFGHGAEGIYKSQEHNYLLPQDLFSRVLPETAGNDQATLKTGMHDHAISLQDVLLEVGRASPRGILAILDCCREELGAAQYLPSHACSMSKDCKDASSHSFTTRENKCDSVIFCGKPRCHASTAGCKNSATPAEARELERTSPIAKVGDALARLNAEP